MTQFSVSTDEEHYEGRFETVEDAVSDGLRQCDEDELDRFWVGEVVPPTQPEEFFDIDQVIDHANDQDDYCSEWAEDWFSATKEQIAEVEASVKAVIGAWFDKHDLRPAFFNIDKACRYDVVDGKAVKSK